MSPAWEESPLVLKSSLPPRNPISWFLTSHVIRLHIRESTKNNTNNQNNAAINYKTTTRIPKPNTRSLLQVTIPELSDEDTLSSSPNFFAANMYDTNDDDEDNASDEDEFNLFQPN